MKDIAYVLGIDAVFPKLESMRLIANDTIIDAMMYITELLEIYEEPYIAGCFNRYLDGYYNP